MDWPPAPRRGHGPLGASFSAAFTETITAVTLAMELKSAGGAGSALVYLVPDGSVGSPSLPTYTPGVPVTLTNAILLGTIFDNNPLLSTSSYTENNVNSDFDNRARQLLDRAGGWGQRA